MLRQKEAVEAENADIKKRLASVMSMLEPLLGNTSHSSNTNNSAYEMCSLVSY